VPQRRWGATFAPIATLASGTTSYRDDNVVANGATGGESVPSNSGTVTAT